jgi:polyhydroxyalkanoate synthase
VWNYVVGNYLKGETPPAFDLLYWNSDSTNLPGPMYTWYLRHTYLENKLKEPGATTVCGVPLDLSSLDLPTYVYASREDHIVPWDSAYQNTRVVGGESRFVLGASGHIAGVINPPAKKKRNYWVAPAAAAKADGELDPVQWFEQAEQHPGSWWPDWMAWLTPKAGRQVPAPKQPGNADHPALEPAPGSYVKQKA